MTPCSSSRSVPHLALCADANVAVDRSLRSKMDGLLNAHVSQSILTEDGACIQVSSHETTDTRKRLDGWTGRHTHERERVLEIGECG